MRIGTGSLTLEQILAAADSSSAAVVGRSFALVPGLGPELKRRYRRVVNVDGIRVYVDPRT